SRLVRCGEEPDGCGGVARRRDVVDVAAEGLPGVALRLEDIGEGDCPLGVSLERHRRDAVGAGEQAPVTLHPRHRDGELPLRACQRGRGFPLQELQVGLGTVARRRRPRDFTAVPVEERERQREPDRRQRAPLGRVAVLDAHLEARRREHTAVREGQRALLRAQAGGGRRDRKRLGAEGWYAVRRGSERDRKSTRLNSSHGSSSYAVFCLKKTMKTVTQWE